MVAAVQWGHKGLRRTPTPVDMFRLWTIAMSRPTALQMVNQAGIRAQAGLGHSGPLWSVWWTYAWAPLHHLWEGEFEPGTAPLGGTQGLNKCLKNKAPNNLRFTPP